MPLYKIVKMWLIPPGIFILLFICIAIFLGFCAYLSKKQQTSRLSSILAIGAGVCCVFACISYTVSINAGAERLLHSLEYKYDRQTKKADAAFVLGGKSMSRARFALSLQRRYKLDIVASGYMGEAERIKRFLLNGKVPQEKIIVEPLATNTSDHVKYILPIALEKGYKKVFIVTDAYHMPRSMLNFEKSFKKYGIEVIPYPTSYLTRKEHQVKPEEEWIPNSQSLTLAAIAWHEYLGMLEVWLTRW